MEQCRVSFPFFNVHVFMDVNGGPSGSNNRPFNTEMVENRKTIALYFSFFVGNAPIVCSP